MYSLTSLMTSVLSKATWNTRELNSSKVVNFLNNDNQNVNVISKK